MPIELPESTGGTPKFPDGQAAIVKANAKTRGAIEVASGKEAPPVIHEPRCHVCTSPHRHFIEGLLIKGANYLWISENVPGQEGSVIDRRSVSNHAKKHMSYQDSAIRAILEEEANTAAQNYEEGVKGAIIHRGGP